MNPFPEEWELLALFEAEPIVIDRDVPRFYNRLIYETARGANIVRCEIEPGYEKLTLTCWRDSETWLSLDLSWVSGLRVVTGAGKDYLIASFRDPNLCDLEFHLKPVVCLRWGTSSQLPPN
jgi:hypothetical protein